MPLIILRLRPISLDFPRFPLKMHGSPFFSFAPPLVFRACFLLSRLAAPPLPPPPPLLAAGGGGQKPEGEQGKRRVSVAFRENVSAKRCFQLDKQTYTTRPGRCQSSPPRPLPSPLCKTNGEFKCKTLTRCFQLRAVLTSTLAVTFQFGLKITPLVHSLLFHL